MNKNELNEKLKQQDEHAKAENAKAAEAAKVFGEHHAKILLDIQTWCNGIHGITVGKAEHFSAPAAPGVAGTVRLFGVEIRREGKSLPLRVRGAAFNHIKFHADREVASMTLTFAGKHHLMVAREQVRGKAPPRPANDLHEWNEEGFVAVLDRWTGS